MVAAAVQIGVPEARAVSFGFDCITNNLASDCAIGEAQLELRVTDPGGGQVLFHFLNKTGSSSSITDVYWDDGSLLALGTITNGPGVSFSPLCAPGNLPGGNGISPPFQTTAGFCADSDPPVQPEGVNPGEWLKVYFTLQGGKTFADVLADMASGALRVGVHVQGFSGGGSESFVAVPEPGILTLLGLGVASLALRRRPGR
jgi:hypothetical protein